MKKVLITGATSGIGLETLKRLVNDYEVYFTYKNNDKLKDEIEKNYNAKGFHLDLNDKNSIEKLVNLIPNIDILINNAGFSIDNDFKLKTYEEFSKVVQGNLTGTYYLTKLLISKINENGNILFISSTNGIDTNYIESIDYDASKAGIISLNHNFAQALAPQIRVNTLALGWVETPMNATLTKDFKKQEEQKILLKRFAKPFEIVNTIEFIISDKASYINDSIIRIDGGVKR